MRNDVQIKTTWVINDNGSELYFDFYNIERKLVGNLVVSDKGKIYWDIIDLNYLENVRELIYFIMQDDNRNKLHFESKDENIDRWNNSCIYIYSHSLVVNRRFNYASNLDNTIVNKR